MNGRYCLGRGGWADSERLWICSKALFGFGVVIVDLLLAKTWDWLAEAQLRPFTRWYRHVLQSG